MRPYILSESHWGTVQQEDYQLAVLPWGATEAHNYHLPYGTDNFETEALVHEAARLAWESGSRVVVLPNIPIGVNTGQTDIRLTLNIHPSTQHAILKDLVESLSGHGLRKLLVVNGHGGNDFRQIIREVGQRHREMFLATCNWYQSVEKDAIFEHPGDHADEMETSLMLYAWPELVLPLERAGSGEHKRFSVEELNETWAWTERKWSRVTADTGIGNPRKATPEKGEKYFRAVVEKLQRLMTGIANTPPDKIFSR
jgi:creatinine amidohydrolase